MIGPSAVIVAATWQQSQVRVSIMDSTPRFPSREIMTVATAISFTGFDLVLSDCLPSSHAAPRPPDSGHIATNPCSVADESVCGVNGVPQVLPPSLEIETRTP